MSHLKVSFYDKYLVNLNSLSRPFFSSRISLLPFPTIATRLEWKLSYPYSGGEGASCPLAFLWVCINLRGTEYLHISYSQASSAVVSGEMWSHHLSFQTVCWHPLLKLVLLLGKHTDWNRPPWPGTTVTICMSCFMIGSPGKEHETDKPPSTGRVRERLKGDIMCPTTSQNPHWHASWISNACTTRKDSELELLARHNP